MEGSNHLGWTELPTSADIWRGKVKSPLGPKKALHTYDFNDGFWHLGDRRIRIQKDKSECGIRQGDLLMKRVGRNCSSSVGKVIGHIGCASSDCLWIVRPKKGTMSTKILFALRVLLGFDFGAQLLECGTGAPYITEKALRDLIIPTKLADAYHKQYSGYREAIIRRDFQAMLSIEDRVRRFLTRRVERLKSPSS